ncbi:MAG: EamA family transporter RarD [Burkholderiaceae bacterium]|nr:EamA family transporter RarD [Burkholderiaceae bacterium]
MPPHPTQAPSDSKSQSLGIAAALIAYGTWGLYPLFFKLLAGIAPTQVLAHRVVWSCALLCAVVLSSQALRRGIRVSWTTATVVDVVLATLFISFNWYVFIYAVTVDRILDVSLGYFLNPIISALLGILVLGERSSRPKTAAIGIAALGMTATFLVAGRLPIIPLILAWSFGFYGLVKKQSKLGSAQGLLIETLALTPFAIAYLLTIEVNPTTYEPRQWIWLIVSGAMTVLPLTALASAAKRIELGTLAYFQYLAPAAHFAIAVWIYNETVDLARMIAFGSTLLAIATVSAGTLMGRIRRKTPPPNELRLHQTR